MTGGRIISLLASATEIVAALGLTERLVAISHDCDYPTEILELPVCTAPKINTTGSSYDINLGVKELVERGLSVFRVDSNKLRALSPDLIITQSQCEVCAVSESDLEDAVANWTNGHPKIVSLRPDCLLDVWRDISNVALAAGAEKTGKNLIAALQKKMKPVSDRAADLGTRPRVACIEWIDPLMAAGNWIPEMVEIAGAIQEGARAYLNRQYMTIGIVGLGIFVLIWIIFGLSSGLGFLIGAFFSGAAGYVGMNISVRSNFV